jgi:hypothetical protein
MRIFVRVLTIAAVAAAAVSLSFLPPARAELATEAEMERICQNWLAHMVDQQGDWAGEATPRITDVREIVVDGVVLARNYSIAPGGHIVVPVLKELPPVKAYSEDYDIDVDQMTGFPALLREVLAHRAQIFVDAYGSLDAAQPVTGERLFGTTHRALWDRFVVDPDQFRADLAGGAFGQREQVGPLLTTIWHQSGPYNNFCPMGDGGRCVVGCVATATVQVMKYWDWPPVGIGEYSYMWDGDQSCGGNSPWEELYADFSDSYDWANMPNSCSGGCNQDEQDALAELCYEVGVSENMDYGRCGSGTLTNAAIPALRNYFRYDPSLDQENRSGYTALSWFGLIQEEINAGRPMMYRITGHAIVCDGWRDTGGENQYHMNYGWGGPYNSWFAIDDLHISQDPMDEYLIRDIKPYEATVFIVRADGTGALPTIQAAVDVARDGNIIELEDGIFTGEGNRDIDLLGKAVTIRSTSGDFTTCIIDCQGSEAEPHRGFYIHSGETAATVIDGITITGGHAGLGDPNGGAIRCAAASAPTIRNCMFSHNATALRGGAVSCEDGSSAALRSCVFYDNAADYDGGGLCCYDAIPEIENCTFVGNSAYQGSGIAALASSILDVLNCVVVFAPAGEPVYCTAGGSATLYCCDVYGNTDGDWVGCIAGQFEVDGNISVDPLFCDLPGGDFALTPDSPCVPYTPPNGECDLVGALGVGCGEIVVYENGSGPFPTITAAIDAAVEGSVIYLADGVFTGDGNRDIDLAGRVLTIRSQSGDPETCIIDCQGDAQEWHRGFYFASDEGPETALEGLTIRNGYSDIGAAAYVSDASPSFSNVVFADNYADFGGALRCRGECYSVFDQVVFSGNGARIGGGVYCLGGAEPTFSHCTFYGNYATNYGAGLRCYDFADPVLENTIIAFSTQGSAISCNHASDPVLSCCDIYGNAGGDWVGEIADQLGINGNFSEDPLFCDAENGDLTIDAASPCAANYSPEDCGLVGARDIGCGDQSDASAGPVGVARLQLRVPVPHSFSAASEIRYTIPSGNSGAANARVRVGVYDLTGRLVCRLVDADHPAGAYVVTWDGTSGNRARVESGVYFCRLNWSGESRTRTLVVLR